MITRLTGILESLDTHAAAVRPEGSGLVHEVLLPAYLAEALSGRIGQTLTLHTLEYLESPNQGATFIPRLVGFASAADRRFFELLTSVKGIGNRKALRALAAEPTRIAAWINARDTRALTDLPEIGKRLAETIIVEIGEKVLPFLGSTVGVEPKRPKAMPSGPADEAIAALVALGATRAEADDKVRRALARNDALASAEEIVAAALAG